MKRIAIVFYLLTSLLFLTRCGSTGFLMARPQVVLFGERYPPKDSGEEIDVYFTNKPTQKYSEFAKITCGDTDDRWNLDQITKMARLIGADGIIIIGKAGTAGVGVPTAYSTYVVTEEYGLTAIAIKYL